MRHLHLYRAGPRRGGNSSARLSPQLNDMGTHCGVVSLGDEGAIGPELRRSAVPVWCLGLRHAVRWPSALSRLRSALATMRPTVVQAWMYPGNLAATLAARLMRPVPALAWSVRQSLAAPSWDRPTTRLAIKLGAFLSQKADVIIYNSSVAREGHEARAAVFRAAASQGESSQVRIAFLITGLAIGGAELMLVRLLESLDRRRFEPYVISLIDAGDVGDRIRNLGIGLLELHIPRGRLRISALWTLVKFLKQWRPAVLHTWMYHADLFGSMAATLAGRIPVVWCIRASSHEHGHISSLTRLAVRTAALLSYFIPARVISCSHIAMQDHIDLGYRPDKFVVIPNGFDLERFRPDTATREQVRCELGVPEDVQLVGFVARFDPLKGHLGFLKAAVILLKMSPRVRFLLAGADVHEGNRELAQAINNAGLSSVMYLLGRRTDVHRLMTAFDVLVSASLSEAFSNVVGEAMACEVPCVVTDVGDSAHIVGNAGRVVRVGDTSALANALHEVLSISEADRTQLGRAARARIHEHFDIRKVVQQYQALYEQLL